MKYIITESRLNNFILNWLDDNLIKVDYPSSPRVFFVRGNEGVMSYDKRNGYTNVNGPLMSDVLHDMFNIESGQIKDIIETWLMTRHDLKPNFIDIY